MRLFIAVPVPQPIQQQLVAVMQSLAGKIRLDRVDVSWVKPENLHITLKFLGECPETLLPMLAQAVEAASQSFNSFTCSFGALGCFEAQGPIRALWVGLNLGTASLEKLAAAIDVVCQPLGFKPESRLFLPHVTLARVKLAHSPGDLRALLQANPLTGLEPFKVSSLSLVRSILSPSGPTYTQLQTIRLT